MKETSLPLCSKIVNLKDFLIDPAINKMIIDHANSLRKQLSPKGESFLTPNPEGGDL